jgi:PAS domain S-box-containing protein
MSPSGSIVGPRKRIAAQVCCRELMLARWRFTLPFLFVFFLTSSCIPALAQEESSPKNILVLCSFTERSAFIELEPLKASLRSHLTVPVNFSVEYLDSVRFEDVGYRKSLSETLHQAYKDAKLDLVIVQAYPALRLLLDYQDQMFPGVPIVFIGVVSDRIHGEKIPPGVTGVTTLVDVPGSLNLALRFHPDTQNVALISGVSEFERYWDQVFREEFRLHHGNLKLIELAGSPDSHMLDQVFALPAHTIVFVQLATQDSAQPVLSADDLLAAVSRHFPTYCIFDYCIEHGGVGGSYPDQEAEGREEGEIAARVLSGEKPENIPVKAGVGVREVVDWRQLRRWNISEGLLALGTVVRNRPPTMWELYKWRMIGFGLLLVMQTLLIIGLLVHRLRRKRAEQFLARQLRFEALISDISSEFINLPLSEIELGIQKSLVRLRDFLGVDRISIFELADKETSLRLRHSATVAGMATSREALSSEDFPWLFAQIGRTEPVVISGLDDLPIDAKGERELFGKMSPCAVAVFPLSVEHCLVGALSFVIIRAARFWPTDLQPQLKAASQVYANAFARELSQKALIESETRFRVMSDTAPAFIWTSDQGGKLTYLNKRALSFTGAKTEEPNGDGWYNYIHLDDLQEVLQAKERALQGHERFVREYRIRRFDDVYRWMFDVGNPRFDSEGLFVGFIGSAVDVTDQKLAREALEKVGGQLIAAQERERSHIARELHDDICQRLAMLSLRIEKVTKGWSHGQAPVGDQLEQIWQQCSNLTGDVQALSHELHPSVLDNLGLVTAIKSFCREFSEQSDATVQFSHADIPDSLTREVSLSFFRVVQEALHNAAKYSGVKQFEVNLQGKSDGMELEIVDRGMGFDVENSKSTEGLGLVSMRERILMLNGKISIESKPNAGTRIRAYVPLTAKPTFYSAHAD